MAKNKKTDIEQAAHIKKHTAGTSNEISFSVLDAAKAAADGDETTRKKARLGVFSVLSFGRKKKPASTPTKEDALPSSSGEIPAPSTSLPTSSVSSQTKAPYQEPAQEIARRKAKRRSYKRLVVALVALASVALIAGGAYLVSTEVSNHNEQVSSLDDALNLVIKADETILAIDELLANPVTEESMQQAEGLGEQVALVKQDLNKAKLGAQQVSSNLRESADKEAARQAIVSIEAREEMLSTGLELVEGEIVAKTSIDTMTEAWGHVLQADSLAREAAALVTNTTNENVEASKTKNSQALEALSQAATAINEIKTAYPTIDLSAHENYVQKKIEALEYAVASDEAILVQDRQTAEGNNASYNRADEEAAELAKVLPDNPVQPVLDIYEAQTTGVREQYQQARTRAGTADSFLRDYLGTTNK